MKTPRPLMLLTICLLATAATGCSGPGAAATEQSSGGSCAVVIEMNGTRYIAGRQSEAVLPVTGEPMPAQMLDCDDGAGRTVTTAIVATRIRGVPVKDAVAADGYQLLLAQRLWRTAWDDLPQPLQPYVHH